jgi:hypothetical protein
MKKLLIKLPLFFPFEGMEEATPGIEPAIRDPGTEVGDTHVENHPGEDVEE